MNIILEEFKVENTNNTYKALDEGIYNALIKDIQLTKSKSGKDMMCVTLELQGEKMINGAHLGGRIERYYIVLNDKYAGQKLHTLLMSCDVDVKPGDNVNINQLVTSNVLYYKNVRVKLKKSTYLNANGEVKECNTVSYVLKAEKVVVENTFDSEDIPF